MFKRSTRGADIIGSTGGPTSIFFCGKKKLTFWQRLQKKRFELRKKRMEKHITDANHTIEEVCEYIKVHHGFTQVNCESEEYRETYVQMRASFLIEHAPKLLGEYAKVPEIESRDEIGIKKFMEQIELRQRAAEAVSQNCFDIDLSMYKKETVGAQMCLTVEKKYGYIGGSMGGDKKSRKQFDKVERDVYRYYGVTKEDIEKRTKRYDMLLEELAHR